MSDAVLPYLLWPLAVLLGLLAVAIVWVVFVWALGEWTTPRSG